MNRSSSYHFLSVLRSRPRAVADISGSESYPDRSGVVRFYQVNKGVIVYAEISGLPHSKAPCDDRIFGFHIHEGNSCSGNAEDPFANTKSHYDKGNCEHPHHSGDMPPLFGNDGLAIMMFFTNRFSIEEIIGRTVVIHDMPDDFKTQPSGNSGKKIACGVIKG